MYQGTTKVLLLVLTQSRSTQYKFLFLTRRNTTACTGIVGAGTKVRGVTTEYPDTSTKLPTSVQVIATRQLKLSLHRTTSPRREHVTRALRNRFLGIPTVFSRMKEKMRLSALDYYQHAHSIEFAVETIEATPLRPCVETAHRVLGIFLEAAGGRI